MIEFTPFPKMPRLSREIVVTEKIDGTNAQIYITAPGEIYIGSRTRWITPGRTTDNYDFARWCMENRNELLKLGPGRHFGEWWGKGIQRGYGLNERRFSLFNPDYDNLPACVSVVPVLYRGVFDEARINGCMTHLKTCGSVAAPGFMKPEGIIIYHVAAGHGFKKTLENDESPKSKAA